MARPIRRADVLAQDGDHHQRIEVFFKGRFDGLYGFLGHQPLRDHALDAFDELFVGIGKLLAVAEYLVLQASFDIADIRAPATATRWLVILHGVLGEALFVCFQPVVVFRRDGMSWRAGFTFKQARCLEESRLAAFTVPVQVKLLQWTDAEEGDELVDSLAFHFTPGTRFLR